MEEKSKIIMGDMYIAIFQGQILPDHWKETKVSLLHKKGDPHDPKNYRPISLLNCDFKMVMTSGLFLPVTVT